MRLYLLPSDYNGSPEIQLKGKQYNYIANVLRLKKGQKIMGRDAKGLLWDLEISEITKDTVLLSSRKTETEEERTDALPQDRPRQTIILYQCIPKGRKTDEIIRRATEAGVKTIVLVKSRNCVADFKDKEESKLSRYDSIIKEAIQQSGSLIPTTVEGVIDISQVPEDLNQKAKKENANQLGLFLHQCKIRENQSNLADTVEGFKGVTGVLVGPEGGLTEDECNLLLQQNLKAVMLKTNILRCETASIYAIGAIQTLLER